MIQGCQGILYHGLADDDVVDELGHLRAHETSIGETRAECVTL